MALSKEKRIMIFIGVDIVFFLIELIGGYYAHSLALIADAFHMLNDVISLCVGLWAVRVATNKASSNEFTYGWARAEILGGLVNGVFLIALCVSIVLEAIQRFFEPQKVTNPEMVLIVGGVGLLFNILGLFVFHQHSHGHGHEHSHADAEDIAEQGTASYTDELESTKPNGDSPIPRVKFSEHDHKKSSAAASPVHIRNRSSGTLKSFTSRNYGSVDSIPTHPASIRQQARSGPYDDGNDNDDESEGSDVAVADEENGPSEVQSLLGNKSTGSKRRRSIKHSKQGDPPARISHGAHTHAQPKAAGSGHGHSHDSNIRGIFLHVVGDALGNVGVMASALIIWLAPWPWRYYFDPAISLFITLIILKSAIPLVKDTAKPLLQAVPGDISIDDIKSDIESLPGIRSCHHVHVWALTPSKPIATLDVELDFDFEGKNAERYMKLAKEIKNCLHGHGIHSSTVQPEFCTDASHTHNAMQTSSQFSDESVQTAVNVGADSKHGCLLDDDCATGQQCCPPDGNAGTTTSTAKADKHKHDHDHRHWYGRRAKHNETGECTEKWEARTWSAKGFLANLRSKMMPSMDQTAK